MSADNYGKCPKCSERIQRLDPFSSIEDNMREDYELWINPATRVFSVQYLARCQDCDFTFAFKHDQKVPV